MIIDGPNLDLAFKGFKAVYSEHFEATPSHIDKVAMRVGSSSSEEEYGWLGQFPDLREWIGDRHVHSLQAHGFSIKNKKFESTVTVKRDDMADDKFGIYKPLFSEMGRVTKQHPDKIAFGLLAKGFTSKCYDGKNFFDTTHQVMKADGSTENVSNMSAGDGPAWFLLDTSRGVKPLVWQERENYEFQSVTDGSSQSVFMRDEFLYGIRARVNCGLGLWQLAYGSTAPLTAANYAAAREAMMNQCGDRGLILGVTPTDLVVPPSLETQARQLLNGDTVEGTTNIWKGTANLILTPFVA